MKTKTLASALCGLGMAVSGAASATIVGGVDFGDFDFHLDTTTLSETFIAGNNDIATGYGVVNTINGNANYAGGNKLYFVFDGYKAQNYTTTSVNFSGGGVRLFMMPTFNLLSQSSAANIANIQANGSLWLSLMGHAQQFTTNTLSATGSFTGNSLTFTGSGMLDVDMTAGTGIAEVQHYLDVNDIADGFAPGAGFADIVLTTSANNLVLNPHDNTAGCRTGQAQSGQWCFAGSADLRGNTVPEPSILALLGLGLLGMGAARRKSSAV